MSRIKTIDFIISSEVKVIDEMSIEMPHVIEIVEEKYGDINTRTLDSLAAYMTKQRLSFIRKVQVKEANYDGK
jgi:hypothetical protein